MSFLRTPNPSPFVIAVGAVGSPQLLMLSGIGNAKDCSPVCRKASDLDFMWEIFAMTGWW